MVNNSLESGLTAEGIKSERNSLNNYKIKIEFAGGEIAESELNGIFFSIDEKILGELMRENSVERFVAELEKIIQHDIKVSIAENICSMTDEEKQEFMNAARSEYKYVSGVYQEMQEN